MINIIIRLCLIKLNSLKNKKVCNYYNVNNSYDDIDTDGDYVLPNFLRNRNY